MSNAPILHIPRSPAPGVLAKVNRADTSLAVNIKKENPVYGYITCRVSKSKKTWGLTYRSRYWQPFESQKASPYLDKPSGFHDSQAIVKVACWGKITKQEKNTWFEAEEAYPTEIFLYCHDPELANEVCADLKQKYQVPAQVLHSSANLFFLARIQRPLPEIVSCIAAFPLLISPLIALGGMAQLLTSTNGLSGLLAAFMCLLYVIGAPTFTLVAYNKQKKIRRQEYNLPACEDLRLKKAHTQKQLNSGAAPAQNTLEASPSPFLAKAEQVNTLLLASPAANHLHSSLESLVNDWQIVANTLDLLATHQVDEMNDGVLADYTALKTRQAELDRALQSLHEQAISLRIKTVLTQTSI